MDNKEDIDKLDRQINKLKHSEEEAKERDLDEEREVIVDRKYDYDDIDDGDTKRLDKIDDIEEVEEESEPDLDEPKKMTRVERLEEQDEDVEELEEVKETRVERLEENEEEKMSKKKKIIIICSVVGIILVALIILLLVLNKKEKVDTEVEEKLSSSEQKDIIEDYGDALKSVVAVYYENQKVLLEYNDAVKLVDFDYKVKCNEHEIYEDGEIYLNKCKINNQATKYSYGKKQEKQEVEETDDKIKVYVNKTTKKATLTEPKEKDNYDVYGFNIDGSYTDLNLLSEMGSDYVYYMDQEYNVHMLNFKTGLKALNPLNYTSIVPINNEGEMDLSYAAVEINDMWGIYNIETRERVVNHIYRIIAPRLALGVSGPPLYLETVDLDKVAVYDGDHFGVINYKTGKEIIPVRYKTMLASGNYLWCVEDNDVGHILDLSNNEYLNNKYDEVYGIVSGKYVLVNDEKDIKMIKLDGKVLYDYGEIELGKFNYALDYNGALFSFNKDDNYDKCIEITYDPSNKKGEVKDMTCGGIAKPILYLYPEKTTKVTVTFDHPEYLETTYPKYKDKWEVTAKSNGDLKDKNNKEYYALYWDEKKVHMTDFSTGFYVDKDNAIDFLESKLKYIGLNDKERNEFIMYWLPILEKNGKSLVYFELTEERESYNKINIEPKPDSLLRLVIHIKKVDKKVSIPKQKLVKFERYGFTAVEWGGTTY